MPAAGYRREIDLAQLGPVLLVASSLILAIRTARWPRVETDPAASAELEREIELGHDGSSDFCLFDFEISIYFSAQGCPPAAARQHFFQT